MSPIEKDNIDYAIKLVDCATRAKTINRMPDASSAIHEMLRIATALTKKIEKGLDKQK